ncbi:MAG: hypothetical protein KJ000_35800 [Pirellulaceae bacterium]|nr:hypothetical protein [Pirellulaceae bacterium]
MWLSSSPFQVSLNLPWFSAVTVRTTPQANWLMIESGLSGAVIANVTR